MKKLICLFLVAFILSGCSSIEIVEEEFKVDNNYEDQFYAWIVNNQLENGLVKSTEDGTMISLYDNALSALVFTMKGDYDKAELIFDFFADIKESELGDQYGGFAQFRDINGDIYGGGIGLRWLGDNAWLLIAINQYHLETQTSKYEELALYINLWIRSLQNDDGSLNSGIDQGGNVIAPVTEAMLDSYNAVPGNDSFHENLLSYLENERYDATNNVFIAWPGNEDYYYALDLSSWGYLSMSDMPVSTLEFADNHFMLTRNDVTGYCMDEDLDAIWTEASLQMATAYAVAGKDYYDQATDIIENMHKLIIYSAVYAKTAGLPYVSNQATMYGSDAMWDGADTKIHLSGTAWYLMALHAYNPFTAGRELK